MSHDVREIADAVLHEGYLLYPYGASALKNIHRFPFGTLYPEAFCREHDAGDSSCARLECAVVGPADAQLSIEARYLQLQASGAALRAAQTPAFSLRELTEGRLVPFEFAPSRGELALAASQIGERAWRVSVQLRNVTPLESAQVATRDEALLHALASAHLLLRSVAAEFVSAIDPQEGTRELAEACRSEGLWPVLVGKPGARDTLLAAPIILYDYPELAPESPGDFFDATEIDELLTLRVLTLTDEEKRAMAEGDPRARALLERTEAAGLERLGELHGRFRTTPCLRPGASVRIRPKARGDIFDLALAGKLATVQAVERDFEGRSHVAVTVDDDPGKDLGAYGHRFFFAPDELELL